MVFYLNISYFRRQSNFYAPFHAPKIVSIHHAAPSSPVQTPSPHTLQPPVGAGT